MGVAFELDGVAFPTGRRTLLAFWKHDCNTCELVLPLLDRLKGIDLLTVSQSSPEDSAALAGGLPVVYDTDLTVSDDWGIDTVPTLYLCEGDGEVVDSTIGWDAAAFEALVKQAGVVGPDLAGLPAQKPGCGAKNVDPEHAPRLRVRREGGRLKSRRLVRAAAEDPFEYFFERGLTDGLPVVPTPERVLAMLDGTSRSPDEVVAVVPPNLSEATVEKVAVNAVMAGCKPEYLPVVLAALEAVCTDEFNVHGVLATTTPVTPMIVVNGPIRHRIGMNSGHNAMGQGNRANATIGRAVQLVVRNVGGGRPGEIDKATQGQPGKYSFCWAEAEEESPWEPLHVERGLRPEDSAVTVYAADGPRMVVDQISRTARQLATSFGLAAQSVSHPKLVVGFDAFFVVSPEHCRTFAADGWTKADVRARIREVTTKPLGALRRDDECGEGLPPGAVSDDDSVLMPKFLHDGQLPMAVAGSRAGMFSAIVGGWASGPMGSQMVTRRIEA